MLPCEKTTNPSGSSDEIIKKKKISDYDVGPVIGNGAFSKVVVGREKSSGGIFAIKVIKKQLLIKLNKADTVYKERNAMEKLRDHPFFVNLFYTFQDSLHLFFVMSYARRGELLTYISALQGFNNETTQFYASEIISAIEYMHSKCIIHRDLKPENILLNENYHIMITDFGTSKFLDISSQTFDNNLKIDSSFVGTCQYVSPELLIDKKVCKSSDLWSLGVTIYQMVTAEWPFHSLTDYYTFERIKRVDYKIPEFFPEICKDLVQKLIRSNPYDRLGDAHTGGYSSLKAHPFFNGVDWDRLTERQPPTQIKLCILELLPTITN